MHIEAATQADKRLFQERTGYLVGDNFRGIKAVDGLGKTLAVTGYDHWTPSSVQMHIWIGNPLVLKGYDYLRESFSYPFEHCGKILAVGVTPSDLPKALKFNKHIGFREVARIKDAWDVGIDMVITEMRPEWCRWIKRN